MQLIPHKLIYYCLIKLTAYSGKITSTFSYPAITTDELTISECLDWLIWLNGGTGPLSTHQRSCFCEFYSPTPRELIRPPAHQPIPFALYQLRILLLYNSELTGELVFSLWCRVSDLNDNAPVFLGTPYSITIPENTAPNTTVFRNRIPL